MGGVSVSGADIAAAEARRIDLVMELSALDSFLDAVGVLRGWGDVAARDDGAGDGGGRPVAPEEGEPLPRALVVVGDRECSVCRKWKGRSAFKVGQVGPLVCRRCAARHGGGSPGGGDGGGESTGDDGAGDGGGGSNGVGRVDGLAESDRYQCVGCGELKRRAQFYNSDFVERVCMQCRRSGGGGADGGEDEVGDGDEVVAGPGEFVCVGCNVSKALSEFQASSSVCRGCCRKYGWKPAGFPVRR